MDRLIHATVLVISVAGLVAQAPGQSAKTWDLIKSGFDLEVTEALRLEKRLSKKPKDWKARVTLLAYYTRSAPHDDLRALRKRRREQLFWLIENKAEVEALSYSYIVAINTEGHPLADPRGFTEGRELWKRHAEQRKPPIAILRNAIEFLIPEDPELAATYAQRLVEIDDSGHALWGRACAYAVVRARGRDHRDGFALWFDDHLRASPFSEQCVSQAQSTTNPHFLLPFARGGMSAGAELYSRNRLDWDYTAILHPILQRARRLSPDDMLLWAIPGGLPERGEPIPMVVRVGGSTMKKRMQKKVSPTYPEVARQSAIEGTVSLKVVVGVDGKIVQVHVVEGPIELQDAAAEAVAQWVYKPTTIGGRPTITLTQIDVIFRLVGSTIP